MLFSERKIHSYGILFYGARIKIRKGFSLPFSTFENLVVRIRVLNQGNRYKVIQRQEIQARGNKNNAVKIKDNEIKSLHVMTIQALSFSQIFGWIFQSNFLY